MAVRIIDGVKYKTPYTFRSLVVGNTYKLYFKKHKMRFFEDCKLEKIPNNFRSVLHMEPTEKFVFSTLDGKIINLFPKITSSSNSLIAIFEDNVCFDVSIWIKD